MVFLKVKFPNSSYSLVAWWMPQNLTDKKMNINSGNGLVPSDKAEMEMLLKSKFQDYQMQFSKLSKISFGSTL